MANPAAFMSHQWAQGGMNQVGFAMAVAASTVVFTMVQQFLLKYFTGYVDRFIRKFASSMDPYVQIKFHEDVDNGGPKNYQAFATIETYLSAKCTTRAPRLKANSVKDITMPVLCIDDGEGVSDEFKGCKVSWQLSKDRDTTNAYGGSIKRRYFVLTFHKMHRELVAAEYLSHVMEQGKATTAKNRQLKIFSNSMSKHDGGYWNYIMNLDHPATFETMAMGKEKKKGIIDDLTKFSKGREYYRRIGKPWKRG